MRTQSLERILQHFANKRKKELSKREMILISKTGPTALIVFHLDTSLGAAILSSGRKQLLPYHEGKEISVFE